VQPHDHHVTKQNAKCETRRRLKRENFHKVWNKNCCPLSYLKCYKLHGMSSFNCCKVQWIEQQKHDIDELDIMVIALQNIMWNIK
jgi:hypothetical protein